VDSGRGGGVGVPVEEEDDEEEESLVVVFFLGDLGPSDCFCASEVG